MNARFARPLLTAAFYVCLLLAVWLGFRIVVEAATPGQETGEPETTLSVPDQNATEVEVAASVPTREVQPSPTTVEEVAAPTTLPTSVPATAESSESSESTIASTTIDTAALPNIIFVVADATRADHVSSYGYERPTTPNLDAWIAAEGVRFDQTITASSWTYPSNGGMLTGRMPSTIGIDWTDLKASIPEGEMLLAEHLHNAGYYTAGFVNNFYLGSNFGFGQGFDVYETLRGSEKAEDLNQLAMNWLETQWIPMNSSQPLFLFIYYYDPHTWYDPPAPYNTLYDNSYTGTLTPDVYQHGLAVVSGAVVPTTRDIEHLIALYDGEISYWDHQFGQMMGYLDGKGELDNSLLVMTSDHGQMFGEHHKWVHRNSLYEEVLRVPLLMRYDGVVAKGHVAADPVSTVDVFPTILDLIGLPVPAGLDGVSLRPQAQGAPGDPTRPVYAEMDSEPDPDGAGHWIAPTTDLRSVRQGSFKYIHHVGIDTTSELYELEAESLYEQADLIDERPNVAEEMKNHLHNWFGLPEEFSFLAPVQR